VRLLAHGFLADENIGQGFVALLRARGVDVTTVRDVGLRGAPDDAVLEHAMQQERVVLTHDADFGTLAIREGCAFIGLVYLRPGNIDPVAIARFVDALHGIEIDVAARFIVVAELRSEGVRVRYRPVRLG
jgi:predicted nuclease of predicted toxin-antitoxin system